MAMEPGGRADKIGNEYERAWLVRLLLGILAGENRTVTPEPAGRPNARADVRVVRTDGVVVRYQCKRENGSKGRWSVADLVREGVVAAAGQALTHDPGSRFVFVSGDVAPELTSLCGQAGRFDGDPEAFWGQLVDVASKDLRTAFERLCRAAEADPTAAEGRVAAFALLRRLGVEVFDPLRGAEDLRGLARVHVEVREGFGGAAAAVDALGSFAFANLGNSIDAARLRDHLRNAGTPARDLAGDPAVAAAVDRLRVRFGSDYAPELINDTLLPRPEAEQVLAVADTAEARVVLVHGPSGSGKSGVLHAVVGLLAARGIPCLPVRLDRSRPAVSAERFGRDVLGLPGSPGACLAAIAAGGRGVLVVDQLDAIRWTAAHSADAWAVCREAVEEVLAQPGHSVVLACRTFDVRDDPQIRAWRAALGTACREVEVGDLADRQVRDAVDRAGGPPPSAAQAAVLRSPHLLSLYCQLLRDGVAESPLGSPAELTAAYWRDRYRRLRDAGCLPEGRALLAALVKHMDDKGVLAAPRAVAEQHDPAGVAWGLLRSLGVLRDARPAGVAFSHQGHLDHLLAARVLEDVRNGGGSVSAWLRGGGQSLFRRGQLRTMLAILHRDDPSAFRATVRELLVGDGVGLRFHLRHLAMQCLGAVDRPDAADLALAVELTMDRRYEAHAVGLLVAGGTKWFDVADEDGLLGRWLGGTDAGRRNAALRVLQGVVDQRGGRVATLLRHLPDPAAARDLAAWVLCSAKPHLMPPPLFRTYLALLRRGRLGFVYVDWKELAGAKPARVARVLAANADRRRREGFVTPPAGSDREILVERSGLAAIAGAAAKAPHSSWRTLYRALRRLAARRLRTRREDGSFDVGNWDARRNRARVARLLGRGLAAAGASLARRHPGLIPGPLLAALRHRRRRTDRVVLAALAGAPPTSAEACVALLLQHPRLFRAGVDRPGRSCAPARPLLVTHAPRVSATSLALVERAVLRQTSPCELKSFAYQAERLKDGQIWRNYFGLAQYGLLLALPVERMSAGAVGRLGVLAEKFGQYEGWVRRHRVRFSRVTAPRSLAAARPLSDREWLRVMGRPFPPRGRWRHDARGAIVEVGHEQFAQSLGREARRDPGRFARLARRFPPNADVAYFTWLLRGLSAAEPPSDLAGPERDAWSPATSAELEAVLSCLPRPLADDVACAAAQLVGERSREPWTETAVNLIADIATNHFDPRPGEFAVHGVADGGQEPDVVASGMNSARGAAVLALTSLVYGLGPRAERLNTAVDRALADSHPAVRAMAVGLCVPWLDIDPRAGLARFASFCQRETDERVLRSPDVGRFLGRACTLAADGVVPVVRRMATVTDPEVAKAGAGWAALLSVKWGRAHDVYEGALAGTTACRAGVAETLSHLISRSDRPPQFVAALAGLFDDPDREVRRIATAVFHQGRFDSLCLLDLARHHVASRAFLDDPAPLIRSLERFAGPLRPYADVLFAAAHTLAGPLAEQARSMAFAAGLTVKLIASLLLRLYEQSQDSRDARLQERCMDAWDALLEARGGYDVLSVLDA
jgi:hypothetical protein